MNLLCNRSIFMVPFTFDNESEVKAVVTSPDSIWRESNIKIEKNVLYHHIQRYLQANANAVNRSDNDLQKIISAEQEYRVYSLKRAFLCKANPQLHKLMEAWEFFSGQRFEFPKVESSFSFDVNRQENTNDCLMDSDKLDDELYHPTLMLWPYAHVGILLFSIQLSKKKGNVKISDLMNFNYLFRKTDTNATECQFPTDVLANKLKNFSSSKDKVKSLEGIRAFGNNLNDVFEIYGLPKANLASIITTSCYDQYYALRKEVPTFEKKIAKKEQEKEKPDLTEDKKNKIEKDLCKLKDEYILKKNALDDIYKIVNTYLQELNEKELGVDEIAELPTWNSTLLISFFLRGLYVRGGNKDQSKVRLFNKLRMHVFTYFQLPEVELLNNRDDVVLNFMRIAHGENSKYNLIIEDDGSPKQYIQPFKNVWFASTVEGCSIMTIMPKEAGVDMAKIPDEFSFFKDYENSIEKRYLWIYVWVLLQRHSQLYWIDYLTKIKDHSLDIHELQDKILQIQKIKVSSFFTDVSDYTHHNRFYQLCKDNLCIGEHFEEIKEKLIPLYELKEKEKDDVKTNREIFFGIVVACFAIASVAYDGLSYYKQYLLNEEGGWHIKPLILVISLVALVIISWWAGNGMAKLGDRMRRKK